MHIRTLSAAVILIGAVCAVSQQASAANDHAQITGTGSSWANSAVNQWVSDLTPSGLQVVYTASGSAQGRKDFANDITDFGVSDIPFPGTDTTTGETDDNCADGRCRDYAYAPLVAGGISFPYQLTIGGVPVRNLRLTGSTLADIFTGQITSWADRRISADNNGRTLPNTPVRPVVHADGSAVSYQFASFLADRFPARWAAIAHGAAPSPYWPTVAGAMQEPGSDGVMNYVSSPDADGAIAMDEYVYPLAKRFPVAKVVNAAGYATLPDAYNVALALRAAVPHDDSAADFRAVWTDRDPRAYPLSYYATMIVPTGTVEPRLRTAQRQTLADYLYYGVCEGQREMAPIGYAPLPLNLTRAALGVVAKLHEADANVDIRGRNDSTCRNPTFTPGTPPTDRLDQITPAPAACDRLGHDPCLDDGSAPPMAPLRRTTLRLAGAGTVVAGSARTLTTTLRTTAGAVPHAAVSIFVAKRGTSWQVLQTLRTDTRGQVAIRVRPTVNLRYQARFAGTSTLARATSATVGVGAAQRVAARVTRLHHGRLRVTGTVAPAHAGHRVLLQRFVHRHWKTVAAGTQHRVRTKRGTTIVYALTFRPGSARSTLRVVVAATPDNLAGRSRTMRVGVR